MRFSDGVAKTPLYSSWWAMIGRCTRPNDIAYHNYGGRGVKVCDEWMDYANFAYDMGPRPKGSTLERIDNAKGYEPGNCRWATPREQANNRRTNRLIELDGVVRTLEEWSRHFGIKSQTVWMRIHKGGWDVERAIKTPVNPTGGRFQKGHKPGTNVAEFFMGRE